MPSYDCEVIFIKGMVVFVEHLCSICNCVVEAPAVHVSVMLLLFPTFDKQLFIQKNTLVVHNLAIYAPGNFLPVILSFGTYSTVDTLILEDYSVLLVS